MEAASEVLQLGDKANAQRLVQRGAAEEAQLVGRPVEGCQRLAGQAALGDPFQGSRHAARCPLAGFGAPAHAERNYLDRQRLAGQAALAATRALPPCRPGLVTLHMQDATISILTRAGQVR